MSGVVSGIAKTFAAVGSAALQVPKAIMGVGATAFTAGAASGAGSMASGGFGGLLKGFTSGGVMGNVLKGAVTQAIGGAAIGAVVGGVTGQGVGKGALIGGLGGALTGGITGMSQPVGTALPSTNVNGSAVAATPTGYAPTGGISPRLPAPKPAMSAASSTIPQQVPSGAGLGSKLGNFLTSEAGASMIAGLGGGWMEGQAMKDKIAAEKEMAEADRQFYRDRDQRITNSYNVDPSVLHGPPASSGEQRWRYDPESRRMVKAAV